MAAARSVNLVDLEFLTQGYHDNPEIGRARLQEKIDSLPQGRYDAVLLVYALCNNMLVGLRAQDIPVVIPRAHDCITFFMGSKDRYARYFRQHPGTYYYTSGWLEYQHRGGERLPHTQVSGLGPCTGGDGYPTHGSDFTHQARIAAKYKAGVRITNEGSDYPTNFWLTRWVASACKHYKTFYGFEPAAGVDEHGLVVRIYNVAASGADQLFEYSGNMTGSLQRREAFRQHIGLLSKGKPVVDTAVYIPKTHITAHPREWQTPFVEAGRIRDALDLDFVDAEMVAEGALRRYRFR